MAQHGRFVSYLRVSTTEQGRSGLGLEAQRKAVLDYLNGGSWPLMAEFVETESGKRNDRPELLKALERCRLSGATLVIAKLDRLSRNAAFLLNLRDAGVRFVAADLPNANDITIGIMAVIAQEERQMISRRTKDALEAAKARGVRLGNPQGFGGKVYREAGRASVEKAQEFAKSLAPTLATLQAQDLGLAGMARALEAMEIKTPRGGAWTATAVRNVLARLDGDLGA